MELGGQHSVISVAKTAPRYQLRTRRPRSGYEQTGTSENMSIRVSVKIYVWSGIHT